METLTSANRSGSVPPERVAIVGIGHELRGDDAAGLVLARLLKTRVAGEEQILILETGPSPENFTGLLRRFQPGLVLLLDSAQMGESPGTLKLLSWEETTGISASSHTLPPYLLGEYLTAELGCRVALLGIQPAGLDFGAPISTEVEKALLEAAATLEQAFATSSAQIQIGVWAD